MFELPDDKIYIIPSPEDKPVKIVFEDRKVDISENRRLPNDREINEFIKWELRSMRYTDGITPQQYRSERGKLKKLRDEVLRFIMKRNTCKYKRCIDYMSKEQDFMSISMPVSFTSLVDSVFATSKFGVITI